MLLLLVPAQHEFVAIRALLHGRLIHHSECVAILKDLLASLLRLHGNNRVVATGPLQVVLIHNAVALEDLLRSLGRVEW